MDKITHQVRAEHWAKIMNECINSGMSKTAWCRANGISVKQFFYWQRILRRETFENSRNSLLPAAAGPHREMAPMVPATQRTVSFTEIKLPSSSQSTAPAQKIQAALTPCQRSLFQSLYSRKNPGPFHSTVHPVPGK